MTPLSTGLGCKTLQGNIETEGQTAPPARQLMNLLPNTLQRAELAFSGKQVAGSWGGGDAFVQFCFLLEMLYPISGSIFKQPKWGEGCKSPVLVH